MMNRIQRLVSLVKADVTAYFDGSMERTQKLMLWAMESTMEAIEKKDARAAFAAANLFFKANHAAVEWAMSGETVTGLVVYTLNGGPLVLHAMYLAEKVTMGWKLSCEGVNYEAVQQ